VEFLLLLQKLDFCIQPQVLNPLQCELQLLDQHNSVVVSSFVAKTFSRQGSVCWPLMRMNEYASTKKNRR